MDAIQKLFSKNAHWRNVLFVIAFPLAVLIVISWAFLGPRYLYSAPLIIVIMLAGTVLKPPKYYYPFCVGALLSNGLIQSLIGYLLVGPILPVFIDLIIGIFGYALIVIGVYQAVFGSLSLSRINEKILNVILVIGFALFVSQVIFVEIHGIKPDEQPKHETY